MRDPAVISYQADKCDSEVDLGCGGIWNTIMLGCVPIKVFFFCCIATKAGEEPGNKAKFNTGYYKQLSVAFVPIAYQLTIHYICFEVGSTPSTLLL